VEIGGSVTGILKILVDRILKEMREKEEKN